MFLSLLGEKLTGGWKDADRQRETQTQTGGWSDRQTDSQTDRFIKKIVPVFQTAGLVYLSVLDKISQQNPSQMSYVKKKPCSDERSVWLRWQRDAKNV